ncbi:MAG: class I SAM-dependent methyltransferase [Minisyncoccia bacterium]
MVIKPKEVIDILTQNFFIKKGDKIAEFGCGGGYFTVLLAEKVGAEGKIYAIDILEDAINETKELIDLFGYKNVVYLKSNVKKLPYDENSFDVVFISQLLFQNEEYEKILEEGLRILKDGGYLIILEPNKKIPFIFGNPISFDILKTYFEVKGKEMEFQKKFNDNYYLAVIKK